MDSPIYLGPDWDDAWEAVSFPEHRMADKLWDDKLQLEDLLGERVNGEPGERSEEVFY
ncbi:MAG TPA: hypothetical protein VHK69_22375 [Chitinophagaceae bacterium]|jgi:hypothetical protein|nr:hypothetical protein [Chitinophagaceae bacterium]